MILKILKIIGLAPSEDDKRLKELIDNSYKSLRVVGRGTIKIDPKEVRESEEFKKAQTKAKYIVFPYPHDAQGNEIKENK